MTVPLPACSPAGDAVGPRLQTLPAGEAGGCPHHWLLESSNGKCRNIWSGTCKLCGATRTWPVEPAYKAIDAGLSMHIWRARREANELVQEATG